MKILHFSDLHLETSFASNTMPRQVASACRMRLQKTLLHILDLAVELEADAITIAGDLFEADRVSRDTAQFLSNCFRQLAPIPILIAPGNHDYYSPISAYARYEWPDNVHIFTEPHFRDFALDDETVVWGIAHTSPSERANLLKDFRVPDSHATHILLMHGSEIGEYIENRAAHAPFQVKDIRAAGFAFGLLGHYHGARILQYGKPIAVYPGSPQPLGFGEEGDHGVAILNMQDDFIECECINTATQSFATMTYTLPEELADSHSLAEDIISKAPARTAEAHFLRLHLSGEQRRDFHVDLDYLSQYLSNYYEYVKIVDYRRSATDLNQLSQEPTVRGAFIRTLQEMMTDEKEDQELIRLALDYGLAAFEGEDILTR